MQKIIPFIWFENQAKEVAERYVSIFPNSRIISETVLPGTPSGDAYFVTLSLNGTEFQFSSTGPLADRNPSFSYMVACKSVEEVEKFWNELSSGADILMPLDAYPFSKKYGWLKDKYGVSWQIMHDDGGEVIQTITPCLMFTGVSYGKAEEAMNLYCSLFNGKVLPGHISRYTNDQAPEVEGSIQYARFEIGGQEFVVMESALEHGFHFNEMQSLVVRSEDQKEMDRVWDALSADPQAEQCGWLKDAYGISWQMVTYRMEEMMTTGTKQQLERIVQAFLPMKRLDVAVIEKAFRGDEDVATKESTLPVENTLWFKRKAYGWGWTPSSWQGWTVTFGYIALLLLLALSIDEGSSVREVMFIFALPAILLTITLVRICYKKGEKPAWQWGNKKRNLE